MLTQVLNNPLTLTKGVADFLELNSMLSPFLEATNSGAVSLASDIPDWISIEAVHTQTHRMIGDDGQAYNEYQLQVTRSVQSNQKQNKVWSARVCISDLLYYLQMNVPDLAEEFPEDLMEEVDMRSTADNSQELVNFINKVLFADFRVTCSTGMREFFTLTAEQAKRQGSFGSQRGRMSLVGNERRPSLVDPFGFGAPANGAKLQMSDVNFDF